MLKARKSSTSTVKVRYPDFTTITRAHSFDGPTTSAERIEDCARDLLRRTDAAEHSVRLLGLSAEGLVPAHLEQRTLFEFGQSPMTSVSGRPSPLRSTGVTGRMIHRGQESS